MIGAGRHTKAKRQVPGRVSLRLRICLSLGKLINPLGFEPCRASSFYLLVKWQAGFHLSLSFFFFPSLSFTPGVNSSAPSPPPVISQCVYLRSPLTNSSSVQLTRANSFEVLPGNGLPGPLCRCLAQLKAQGRRQGTVRHQPGQLRTCHTDRTQQASQARPMPLPCPVPPRRPERRAQDLGAGGDVQAGRAHGSPELPSPTSSGLCSHLPSPLPARNGRVSSKVSHHFQVTPESSSTGTCLVMKTSHVCYHGSHTFPHRGPGPGGRTNIFLWVKFLQGHGKNLLGKLNKVWRWGEAELI